MARNEGDETVLARGGLAFDLDAKGNLVYTNGSAVYRLNENNKSQRLPKDKLIQDVVIVWRSSTSNQQGLKVTHGQKDFNALNQSIAS